MARRLLYRRAMKSAAVALVSLLALAVPRIADACEPYQTCGDQLCVGGTAVVEADVLAVELSVYGGPADLHIVAIYGDMTGFVPDTDVTVANYGVFGSTTVGKRLPLLVTRDTDGTPRISVNLDPSDLPAVGCLDPNATTAEIADIVLSPDCYHTLTPVEPPPPDCPDGACNAGRGRAGLPLMLVLGLALRRRRGRTQLGPRTTCPPGAWPCAGCSRSLSCLLRAPSPPRRPTTGWTR
jgi:hypothetical protein